MPSTVLTELHYLSSTTFFAQLSGKEQILIEACEHFQKQTVRNRCYILSANGIHQMSIPVHSAASKQLIRDVRIDASQPWAAIHWRSIQSAYGKAPFFEYYSDAFRVAYLTKWRFLFDLNLELLSICLNLIRIKKEINLTETYQKTIDNTAISDNRNAFHKKLPELSKNIPPDLMYTQVFGDAFVYNASILDLIFTKGPESGLYLERLRQYLFK